ncbi:MAG: gliding motility-associated C-terminal domain-containing protein [Chitinophagaceae bacterium]|nr:MAG: gliding motility-associated C-terminal domain-containing protein [Chitinophagaceae bacterium]
MFRRFCCMVLYWACLLRNDAAAQYCPPNIGFENGTFDSWTPLPMPRPQGPYPIQIMRATSPRDRYGDFSAVCPYGGNFSAKVGQMDYELKYTLTIPPGENDFVVTYYTALVTTSCEHMQFSPPAFRVRVLDLTEYRYVPCGTMEISIRQNEASFLGSDVNDASGNSFYYRDWTPGVVRLRGRAGHDIEISFYTMPSNCEEKHTKSLYAYVDLAEPCNQKAAVAASCVDRGELSLRGPYGYQGYAWYNHDFSQLLGTTRDVTLTPSPPVTSGHYWVVTRPFPGLGCADTFRADVEVLQNPPAPKPLDTLVYCKDQAPIGLNHMRADPGCFLVWYRDRYGGIPLERAPVPSTVQPGLQVYWVAQQRLLGCEGPRTPVYVRVVDRWPLSYTINSAEQCLVGNRFLLTNTTPPLAQASVFWENKNTRPVPVPFLGTVGYTYTQAGTFDGLLRLSNAGVCSHAIPVHVNVLPSPVARIEASGDNCTGLVAAPVRDASMPPPGDPIVSWWWKVAGTTSTTQVPTPMPLVAGPLTARLCVVSAKGCRSDTVAKTIQVGARPIAAFAVATACSNDSTTLNDRSYPPDGFLGQPVVAWHWTVDGNVLATGGQQHPRVLLPGGQHLLGLVAESNLGCRSARHDSLIDVRPAPGTTLAWSDSCAGRELAFAVRDSNATNIDGWQWSFNGSPYQLGPERQRRRYAVPGSYSVSIASANNFGCRDTLRANVRIYGVGAPPIADTLASFSEQVPLFGGGAPGTRYLWTPATGLSSDTAAAPIAFYDHDLTYRVYAVSPEGCDRSSFITVRRMMGPDIYVPNAFTPNNDGKNDVLRPVTVGIRELRYFSVFDRNGQRVFHSSDSRSGWDGKSRGLAVGTSTFVYITEGIAFDGRRVFRKGTVTLIR